MNNAMNVLDKTLVSASVALTNMFLRGNMKKPIPSPSLAALQFEYECEPGSGLFRRKVVQMERPMLQVAGKRRRRKIPKHKYIMLPVAGHSYQAHRLVWLWVHGKIGAYDFIDHIDGNKHNNRISNLRLCTQQQNSCNRAKPENNTSGYKGVSLSANGKRWVASITARGVTHHLGTFDTTADAHAAYWKAAKELHGEFANPG